MNFDLQRFIEAQAAVYPSALAELKNGRKTGHWMWFVFPQIRGLGASQTSRHFAIQNLQEAAAYLADPLLGPRLIECTEVLLALQGKSAAEVFGYPDDLKLRSSLTLFELVAGRASVFGRALDKYFQGQRDDKTLALAGQQ